MITVRRADDRGKTKLDWLLSFHSFSFGTYHDPAHMGFKTLRVLNEDRVAPEAGFPMHPHRDMEILSYVVRGTLEHKDSLGNHGVIREGEIQLMSAGSGVTHSEFNPSETEPLHFLQIWIRPEKKGLEPAFQKKFFYERERINRLQIIASSSPAKGALHLNQQAEIYLSNLKAKHTLEHLIKPKSDIWIQMVKGEILIGEIHLKQGDGAGFIQEEKIEIGALSDSEFLLFSLQAD